MPHIPGHIEQSFLRRRARPLSPYIPDGGGLLLPVYTGNKDYDVDKYHRVDFPIIFANNNPVDLHYFEKVRFCPQLICLREDMKWYMMAINLIIANPRTHSKPKGRLKAFEAKTEIIFKDSFSFRTIYIKPDGKKRTDDEVVEWIIDYCVPFDEMNLR